MEAQAIDTTGNAVESPLWRVLMAKDTLDSYVADYVKAYTDSRDARGKAVEAQKSLRELPEEPTEESLIAALDKASHTPRSTYDPSLQSIVQEHVQIVADRKRAGFAHAAAIDAGEKCLREMRRILDRIVENTPPKAR